MTLSGFDTGFGRALWDRGLSGGRLGGVLLTTSRGLWGLLLLSWGGVTCQDSTQVLEEHYGTEDSPAGGSEENEPLAAAGARFSGDGAAAGGAASPAAGGGSPLPFLPMSGTTAA